ncbi:MAG: 2-C-methyl-D-erythritol 4-phosphate cytidylyltransferase [Halioglobus sp.]
MNDFTGRCWGVLPAAGIGSRMGTSLPKQYLLLQGQTVMEHSLQALLDCPHIDTVMVALHPEDDRPAAMACFSQTGVMQTTGGATRSDSVLAALKALEGVAESGDWVLVHDAARPCVSAGQIAELIHCVGRTGVGGILAEPIVDTVKRASQEGHVLETLDRSTLWRAQTPQMFRLGELRSALEDAKTKNLAITDEASAMELAGHAVQLVKGSARNLKITLPEHLPLAEYYLQDGSGEQ